VHEPLDAIAHQVGAGAFDEVDERQLVLQRQLLHAQDLVQAHRLDGAGFDARIAGHDHAADARHEADARDDAAPRHRGGRIFRVLHEARQRAQRQVRRARIEQQRHAFARQQLPALVEHGLRLRRGRGRALFQRAQLRDPREHGFPPLQRQGAMGIPGR
jgi:hypothetical protein